jgi:hypothetical protein
MISGGGWLVTYHYRRLGIGFVWECPAVFICVADRLGPELMGVLRLLSPAGARPMLWLAEATFTPRESLVEVSWSVWGFNCVWCCDTLQKEENGLRISRPKATGDR